MFAKFCKSYVEFPNMGTLPRYDTVKIKSHFFFFFFFPTGVSQNFVLQILLHAAAGAKLRKGKRSHARHSLVRARDATQMLHIFANVIYNGVFANYFRRKWDLKSRSVTSRCVAVT